MKKIFDESKNQKKKTENRKKKSSKNKKQKKWRMICPLLFISLKHLKKIY